MALRLRQIEAFRAVIREGSMVRASAVLSVTQPAVSYLIGSLETAVGFPLFVRARGKLTPTPEALQLMTEVDRLYDGLGGIESAARQIANHERATVRILITQALCGGPIVRDIGRFAALHPGLKLDIDIAHRTQIEQRVHSGLADLGISSLPATASPQTERIRLFRSRFVCVYPTARGWSQKVEIVPQDLEGESIVALNVSGLIRARVDRWFAAAGVVPRYAMEVGDAGIAIELVRGGLGVTIVSALSVPSQGTQGLGVVPLAPAQYVDIGAVLPSSGPANRTVGALVEFLRAQHGATHLGTRSE